MILSTAKDEGEKTIEPLEEEKVVAINDEEEEAQGNLFR